jgi:hypothetical protein
MLLIERVLRHHLIVSTTILWVAILPTHALMPTSPLCIYSLRSGCLRIRTLNSASATASSHALSVCSSSHLVVMLILVLTLIYLIEASLPS